MDKREWRGRGGAKERGEGWKERKKREKVRGGGYRVEERGWGKEKECGRVGRWIK
jgi:hypothetical protein